MPCGRRLADHALMQHRAQIAHRPEDLGAGHQHDQQRLEPISPCDTRHAPSASAAAAPIAMPIGDAAGQTLGRQHPHRRVGKGRAPARRAGGRKLCSARTPSGSAGPARHRGTRRQTPSSPSAAPCRCAVDLRATTAGANSVTSAAPSMTSATGTSHHTIKAKIAIGRQRRDRGLRQELAEKALQLLDAVDHRQHHPAGALAGEPGRPQLGDLVVQLPRSVSCTDQPVLVRDDGARHGRARRAAAPRRPPPPPAAPDARTPAPANTRGEQQAEEHDPRDPEPRGADPERDRQRDPAAQPPRQLP